MVLETKLEGLHAMVTGGTKGIGKSIVKAFLAQGATVSYCARSTKEDDFESPKATGTNVDVGKREDLLKWVQASGEKHGRIDIIVANASAFTFDSAPEDWQATFNVDLMGFANMTEAATPWLEKSPQAAVVVISSLLAREFFRSPPAPYGPLKAAQLQHVQELSHFLGPKGIRVNAISPGSIYFEGGAWEKYTQLAPEWVESKKQLVPLKRMGAPEEIANTVIFLSSPLSSFITGANILADGGGHFGTSF